MLLVATLRAMSQRQPWILLSFSWLVLLANVVSSPFITYLAMAWLTCSSSFCEVTEASLPGYVHHLHAQEFALVIEVQMPCEYLRLLLGALKHVAKRALKIGLVMLFFPTAVNWPWDEDRTVLSFLYSITATFEALSICKKLYLLELE